MLVLRVQQVEGLPGKSWLLGGWRSKVQVKHDVGTGRCDQRAAALSLNTISSQPLPSQMGRHVCGLRASSSAPPACQRSAAPLPSTRSWSG